MLYLKTYHGYAFSSATIFIIVILYAVLSGLFMVFPTYGYFKKHRPDIFKEAFVELPFVDSFKFIMYVFSGITNEDDKDEVLLKKHGRINIIIGFGIMVSGFLLIG